MEIFGKICLGFAVGFIFMSYMSKDFRDIICVDSKSLASYLKGAIICQPHQSN